MPKPPSDATKLRTAKAAITRLQLERAHLLSDRDAYRARAMKAEQEACKWRERFDELLLRLPTKPAGDDRGT